MNARTLLDQIVRRPLLWVMFYAGLIAYGVYALVNIHAEVLPQFNLPQVRIVAQLPGATTLDLEGLIARPIEAELMSLPSLAGVRTAIGQGSVEFDARFVEGTPAAIALQEVNGAIGRIAATLPPGNSVTTEMSGNAINEVADYAVRIPAGVDASAVQRVLETDIVPRIRAVAGVQKVSVAGPGADAIWVRPDLLRMQRFDVSVSALASSLKAATAMIPSGYLSLGHQDVFIEGRSLAATPAHYAAVAVAASGGTVPVSAVADVTRAAPPAHHAVMLDGQPTIALVVFKQPGASTVPVVSDVDRALREAGPQLPGGARFVPIYSQAHIVGLVSSDLTRNLGIGALLAVVVLFWMLGASRGVAIVALSIPLSLLLGIAGLYVAGQSLNLLTFGALSVAVGLLADDAIIVLESIYHRWEAGDARGEGAMRGLADIAGPDVSGTLTTVAVFLPLAFVGGLAGLFFVPFALAMTFSLIASLLVSLSLIPLALGFLGPPRIDARRRSGSRAVAWLKRHNERLFEYALRRPRLSLWGCVGVFVVSIVALVLVPVDFLPLPNEAVLLESFTLPPGTSLHDANDAANRIAWRIRGLPFVAHVFARVGSASGSSYTEPAYAGEIQVALKPGADAHSLDAAGAQIQDASKLPGVQTAIGTPTLERVGETLSGLPQPFVIDLYGNSVGTLQSLSAALTQRLATVPDLSDVFNNDGYPVTELQIVPKPQALSLHSITAVQLFAQLHLLLAGETLASVPEGNGHLDVYLRLADPAHLSLEQLRQLPVMANGWTALSSVADVSMKTGPNVIRHLNGLRAIEILATPTAPLGRVIPEAKKALATVKLPPGYELRFAGLYPQLERAVLNVAVAAAVALVLMLGILALQFDGWLVPGLLLLQMPLAFSGGAIALAASGVGLNAIGLVAFLTLTGVSLNHGIVLLQRVKRNEAAGLAIEDAVRQAVSVRFRPILLTVLTASLGLLPTALGIGQGAAPEQGLAIVTLGGLVWSGLLSTNLLPALYVHRRKKGRKKSVTRT